jgi:hypothetical protein
VSSEVIEGPLVKPWFVQARERKIPMQKNSVFVTFVDNVRNHEWPYEGAKDGAVLVHGGRGDRLIRSLEAGQKADEAIVGHARTLRHRSVIR